MTGEIGIAMCRPVDLSGLPDEIREATHPAQVDDTMMPCAKCNQPCWVGPMKLLAMRMGTAVIMCYMCATVVMTLHRLAGNDVRYEDVDPNRQNRPRGT